MALPRRRLLFLLSQTRRREPDNGDETPDAGGQSDSERTPDIEPASGESGVTTDQKETGSE